MFVRTRWYATLAFTRSPLGEDQASLSPRSCGSVFMGICDTDICRDLPLIGAEGLKEGVIFWHSLNRHVPIREDDARRRFGCEAEGGRFDEVEVCRMAELWTELLETVAAPALWSRPGRRLVAPGLVPWVRLSQHG